jgi:hypothetical protein
MAMPTLRENIKRAWREGCSTDALLNLGRLVDKFRYSHGFTSEDTRQLFEDVTGEEITPAAWAERLLEVDALGAVSIR